MTLDRAATAKPVALLKNFHAAAVDALGRGIAGGRYATGSALPIEPVLCEELGVSRTTVREAIKTLAAKGMVKTGPKVGTRVLDPGHWNLFDADVMEWRTTGTPQTELVRDLMELRLTLEPAAAALAAERATPEDIATLRSAFAAMVEAVVGRGSYHAADLAFHRAIFHATQNQFLRQMAAPLGTVMEQSFRLSTESMATARASLPQHEKVLLAIAAHKPQAASRALRVLIEEARADIERSLARSSARPARKQ